MPPTCAAAVLADDLEAAIGRRLRIVRVPWYAGEQAIWVGDERPFQIPVNWVPTQAEGYALRIDSAGVLLAGADSAGLFYATRTFAQILRLRAAGGNALPGVAIRDWPALRYRGVMLDIARQVERADYMQTFVRKLADYKTNLFALYFEDKFRWKKHASLSHPLGYKAAEFRALAKVAEEHHMEFVPALASLGHCEGILAASGDRPPARGWRDLPAFAPPPRHTQTARRSLCGNPPAVQRTLLPRELRRIAAAQRPAGRQIGLSQGKPATLRGSPDVPARSAGEARQADDGLGRHAFALPADHGGAVARHHRGGLGLRVDERHACARRRKRSARRASA